MLSSHKGCWTCRARRKRCDGSTPRCHACGRLGIDCAGFGTSRPRWMDGGVEQRAYCGWLKQVVKSARRQQIDCRRQSYSSDSGSLSQPQPPWHWLAASTTLGEIAVSDIVSYQNPSAWTYSGPSSLSSGTRTPWTDSGPSSLSSETELNIKALLSTSQGSEAETTLFSPSLDETDLLAHDWTAPSSFTNLFRPEAAQYEPPPLSPTSSVPEFSHSSLDNADCETDWDLLMWYLDCTMQRVFPFHCSVEHAGIRGYMLHLIHQSCTVRTTLMSVVSYELEQEQTGADLEGADSGAGLIHSRWLVFYRRASNMISLALERMFNDETHMPSERRYKLALETMVAIVHLFLLESRISDKTTTNARLQQGCKILRLLGTETPTRISLSQHHLKSFFTSVIIRWLVFHRIAYPQELSWSFVARALETVSEKNLCGYHISLVEVIWRIEDLATWIRGSAATGVLSTLEVAKRAHDIEVSIAPFIMPEQDQMLPKNEERRSTGRHKDGAGPFPAAAPYYRQNSCRRSCKTSDIDAAPAVAPTCPYHSHRKARANSLLARAAQVFLHIVISGPNPCLPEIRDAVQGGVGLLHQWETTSEMTDYQALSWPLAIIRSMAVSTEDRETLDSASAAYTGAWNYP